jgi:hypothetical protein
MMEQQEEQNEPEQQEQIMSLHEQVELIHQIQNAVNLSELTALIRPVDLPNLPLVAVAALRRSMELRSPNHDNIIVCITKALIRNIPMSIHTASDCLVSLSILYEKDDAVFERYGPIQLLLFASMDVTTVKYLSMKKLLQLTRIAQRFLPEVQDFYENGLLRRLGAGDLLATVTASDVSQLFGLFQQQQQSRLLSSHEKTLLAILAKRVRKTSVRNDADGVLPLLQVMQSARAVYQTLMEEDDTDHQSISADDDRNDDDDDEVEDNIESSTNNNAATESNDNDKDDFADKLRSLVLSLGMHVIGRDDFHPTQMALVFKSIRSLYGVERPPGQYLKAIEKMDWDEVSAKHVAIIVDALTHWRIKSLPVPMQRAGERLMSMPSSEIYPWQANTVLRSAALLYRHQADVMRPYEALATRLIHDDDFLAQSSVAELANLAWFVAFKSSDQSAARRLGKYLLQEPRLVNECAPKQASRIISAYAHIPMPTNDADHALLVRDLYAAYGVHLLSNNLNPAELSSAIYGYAKVDYGQDSGVFDHLVQCMVQDHIIDSCTTRQCVQTLWACGKMFLLEQAGVGDGEDETATATSEAPPPPYVANAIALARHVVVKHADELLPVEVSQTLRALGRLNVRNDDDMIPPLLVRAGRLSDALSPVETSNILWAMGKFHSKDYQTVFQLSRPYATTPVALDVQPKEASTMLYALGRLNVRDEGVFAALTDQILRHVGDASPQIIASVLRAHALVQIPPPYQLLDHWATTKLGLRDIVMTA